MEILDVSSVMSLEEMNTIANNPQLFIRLDELDREDPIWYACQGYPGGTVIGNKKDTVRLDGVHIKLGTRFSLRGKAENNRFNLRLNQEREFRQDLAKGQELIDKHYALHSVSAPEGRVPEEPNLPKLRTPRAFQEAEDRMEAVNRLKQPTVSSEKVLAKFKKSQTSKRKRAAKKGKRK